MPLLKNARGQALVQTMVAAAVGLIVIMAMSSSQYSISRENRGMAEKLASIDLFRNITSTLSSSANCSALFTQSNIALGSLQLPVQITAGSPVTLSLNSIPQVVTTQGYNGNSGLASPLSATLTVLSATPQAANIPPGIQLTVTGSNPYTGTLSVNFDQSKLVHPLHNLVFNNVSLTTTNGALSGCSLVGNGTPAGFVKCPCGVGGAGSAVDSIFFVLSSTVGSVSLYSAPPGMMAATYGQSYSRSGPQSSVTLSDPSVCYNNGVLVTNTNSLPLATRMSLFRGGGTPCSYLATQCTCPQSIGN